MNKSHNSCKSILSIICVLFILTSSVCVSCTNGINESNVTSNTNGSNTAGKTVETEERDSLPDNLNYDGQDIIIHTRGDSTIEIFSDGTNGTFVNNLVFNRNAAVESRLGINIKIFAAQGWQQYDLAVSNLAASINSNDQEYDLVAGWSARIPALSTYGVLYNLSNLGYLDLNRSWWNQSFQTELNLGGKVFFVTGDASLTFLNCMSAYAFNYQVAEDLKIEDLYTVVKDKRWTVEYVDTLIRDMYKDDGDGEINENDFFGLITSSENDADAYLQGFHVTMSTRDADGYPRFKPDTKFLSDVAEKVYNLTWGNPGCRTNNTGTTDYKAFEEDHSLLITLRIGDLSRFTNMSSDYGVLPYPLYDDQQKEYGTRLQDGVSLWCIPIDAVDVEMSTAILEALGSESYRKVTPKFFDVMLKNRYSRDAKAAEMMDLIKDSVWVTFDSLYNESIGYPWHYLRYMMMAQNKNFSSFWAMCASGYEQCFENTIEKIIDLDYQDE